MVAAAAGLTIGAASATLYCTLPPALPICGTYELLSFVPNGGKDISGQLVYRPDGSMSTHFVVKQRREGEGGKLRSMYTGYEGKWWLHEATSLSPPHGGALVEHDVHASSHHGLIGQTMRQGYNLSRDGRKLTTTHASFAGAPLQRSATLEWRRL